jgi:hypothetical protein
MVKTMSDQESVEELFIHMLGKEIDAVAVNEDDEVEITLSDGSLVVFYSSEDLSIYYEIAPKGH